METIRESDAITNQQPQSSRVCETKRRGAIGRTICRSSSLRYIPKRNRSSKTNRQDQREVTFCSCWNTKVIDVR